MSTNWVSDINLMHQKYGVHEWIKKATPFQLKKYIEFRLNFIKEEYDETREAIIMEDAEEIVDGLIDICVVAIGTLDAMGINSINAWNTVLEANMAKEVGVKESRPNPLGIPDLIKPEGWTAPSHKGNHGKIPTAFEPDIDEALDELLSRSKISRMDIIGQNGNDGLHYDFQAGNINQQAQDEIAASTGKLINEFGNEEPNPYFDSLPDVVHSTDVEERAVWRDDPNHPKYILNRKTKEK